MRLDARCVALVSATPGLIDVTPARSWAGWETVTAGTRLSLCERLAATLPPDELVMLLDRVADLAGRGDGRAG